MLSRKREKFCGCLLGAGKIVIFARCFDKVLLTDNDGQVKVGSPVVEGASVSAKIVRHLKDDKIIVFKKKRRKGYKVKNGHRQYLTQVLIEDITVA